MLPAREWRGGVREEYQTQHFGFGAQELTVALRGAVEGSIVENVRAMENSLLESLRLEGEDRRELTSACDKLISKYMSEAAPSIIRLDEELDRLLEIPDGVVLPEDEEKAGTVSEEELEKLKREVNDAEKRVQRAALMEALLKVEIEELKSVEKHCELARQTVDSLEDFQKRLLDKTEAVGKLQRETRDTCDGFPGVKKT